MLSLLKQYKTPLIIAFSIHVLLLTLLCMHSQSKPPTIQPANNAPIIQATAVSAEQLQHALPEPTNPVSPPPLPKPVQSAADTEQAIRQREQEKLLAHQQQERAKQAEQLQQDRLKAATLKQQAELKKQQQLLAKQEQAAQELAAKKQAEQASQAKKAAQTAAFKKEQERLLAQELADEDQALSASRASSASQGEIDKYKTMIVQAISRQWLVPAETAQNISCKLLIHLAPGGMVVSVDITTSSGNTALDRSARAAVYKASPLPVPDDPNLFDKFRNVSLTVRPERAQSN